MPYTRILIDNAYEAWMLTIRHCDMILSGRATLQYQKGFVSLLQNAIELFLKQIMIDNNDHSVAWIDKIKTKDDAQLMLDYMTSNDLNSFFQSLDSEKLRKFKSVDFNTLIKKHRKILKDFFSDQHSFTPQLKKLQLLRNNETHFFIEKQHFLNETDYLMFYNFMIEFYKVLEQFDLLPFWGKPRDKYSRLVFLRTPLTSFSYKDAIKSSKLATEIASLLQNSQEYGQPSSSAYEITENIFLNNPQKYNSSFNDILAIVEMMLLLNMIDYNEIIESLPEELDPTGSHPNEYYIMKVII